MNRISSKIFAVLMVVAMLFSSVAVSVSAQGENNGSIVVSNVTGNAGETVVIDVSLANNPGFTCMILNISYDMDALELISVVDTALIPGKMHTTSYNSPYQLTWQNYTAASDFTANGVIATLTFKIKDSAANGKYDICVYYDVDNYEVTDAMMNPVAFDLINGSITVGSEEPEPEEPDEPVITEPTVFLSSVVGNAGETVAIDVSLANNPGFTCMILNISYDMDALELISVVDTALIPGKMHTTSYNSPYQLTWQNYTATSDFTANGVIATLTFKIKDSVANGKYDIGVYYDVDNYEVTDAMMSPVSFDFINGSITVGSSEPVATYVIDDKITVIEADVKHDSSVGGDASLVAITKGTAKYEFLCVSETTKRLCIEVEDGVYADLYDYEGNAIVLDSNDATPIALIYDDVNGTVRCYVNGNVAYYYETAESHKLVNDFSINDSAFMVATGDEDIWVYDGVTCIEVYNICDSGTAEVVAFQEHNEENSIRILAGVDMSWYGLVGFEIEVYKDGIGQGVEVLSENTIFESVYANDKTVKAEEFGYRYFAACVIKDVDVSDGSSYYINVKPFTKVGETVYYGSADIINIDANGKASFAE